MTALFSLSLRVSANSLAHTCLHKTQYCFAKKALQLMRDIQSIYLCTASSSVLEPSRLFPMSSSNVTSPSSSAAEQTPGKTFL